MKAIVPLLLCLACAQDECVLPGAGTLVAGSGTASTATDSFAMDGFAWREATAPTITKTVSFSFTFGVGPSVECDGIPWASLAGGGELDVSTSCVAVPGSTGSEAQLVAAALSVSSTINAANEGTLTLHFAADAQDLSFVDDQGARTNVHLAIDGAVATISFARAACPSQGCGINLSNV